MANEKSAPTVASQILSLAQVAREVGQAGPKVAEIAAQVEVTVSTPGNASAPEPQPQAESAPKVGS